LFEDCLDFGPDREIYVEVLPRGRRGQGEGWGWAGQTQIAELLNNKGAYVNAKDISGETLLDWAELQKEWNTADLLHTHGGKTGEELKAEGK